MNTSRALIVANVFAASLMSACARATVGMGFSPHVFASSANDLGIPTCDPGASADPLVPGALECWFTAAHGRWRTISHDDHYTELVVHVQAVDLDDAREIAQMFVAAESERFTEISVYAQKEGARADSLTRRVAWTRDGGFALMDFRGAASSR